MCPSSDTDEKISLDTELDEEIELDSLWHVMVRNDPVNLMNYVVLVIRRVFGYDQSKARKLMLEIHHKGKAVLWTGGRERAEHYVCILQQWQITAQLTKNV